MTLSLAGYYFNQIEIVRTHFQIVVLAIVAISLIPIALHALQGRSRKESSQLMPLPVVGDKAE